MPSTQISDLINPMRLRLGVKRAFTGDIGEILGELFQNSQRAGARNARILTDDKGFIYQDDGCGLRDEADFEALVKLGESGWDQRVEEEQQPMGLGVHALLAHEEIESLNFCSNLLVLTLDCKKWWVDEEYIVHWRDNLRRNNVPLPGLTICVTCSKGLTESLNRILNGDRRITRSPAQGYHDLLNITLNNAVVDTKVPPAAMPELPLIETEYQNNRLVVGLRRRDGYPTTKGLLINWFGQLIDVALYSHFSVYLEVRRGRPVNPMAPSRRGVIKDEALQNLLNFIRDSLAEYFTQTPSSEIDALALEGFYCDHPEQARRLPIFVAARHRPYESGGDVNDLGQTDAPAIFSYERPPLLLADNVRILQEDGKAISKTYGLNTFLDLTGPAYKALAADNSRLRIEQLWWKPGLQNPLPEGCSRIFYEAGQWSLGSENEPPTEWLDIGEQVVFTFNDPSNWDVEYVDFTVGGADPQEFYQTDAWAGFDPDNDDGQGYEEISGSYTKSCEHEIRKILGNAVPMNFSWGDLMRFAPEGQQVARITPEYESRQRHRPAAVTLTLSNDEEVRLKLF